VARKLRRTQTALVRLEMRKARMTAIERAAQQRAFQLGGLIVKAGLADEEPAVVLGILTAGARVLKAPNAPESRRRWRELGERVLGIGPRS
jgi:Conjugal transfer protein TraD